MRWYLVKGGVLTEVINKAKIVEIRECATTFKLLCTSAGDCEEGVRLVLRVKINTLGSKNIKYHGIFYSGRFK